jgi:hypothetical protein
VISSWATSKFDGRIGVVDSRRSTPFSRYVANPAGRVARPSIAMLSASSDGAK